MVGEQDRYVLEGFAVPRELDRVHALLERAGVDHPGLDPTDLMLFETAVIEIANNVVEHGRPRGEVRWRLTLRVSDEAIEAELVDTGEAFEADLGGAMPDGAAETGRGLPIAEAVLDKIALTRVDATNRWHLLRRLGGPEGSAERG
jgi:serine/threonine-protein kinase RsbW